VWVIAGIPTLVMYTMSTWALLQMTLPRFADATTGRFSMPQDPVPWVGVILIGLAALMLVEAVRAILGPKSPPSSFRPAVAST
jgi:hypothetical protein